MKNLLVLIVLVLGLSLSGCTPTVIPGQTAKTPIEISVNRRLEVVAGQQTFVRIPLDADYFNITESTMDRESPGFTFNDEAGTFKRHSVEWFHVEDIVMLGANSLNGWTIHLEDASVTVEISSADQNKNIYGRSANFRYYNYLEFTFAITPPAEARGNYMVEVSLNPEYGRTRPVRLNLNVIDPADAVTEDMSND